MSDAQVISHEQARILWDSILTTSRLVDANRSDIVLFNKTAREAMIFSVTVPTDDKFVPATTEMKRKYQLLAVKLKDMYKLRKVEITPVIIAAHGVVTKDWQSARTRL